jgi:hypothetical protein
MRRVLVCLALAILFALGWWCRRQISNDTFLYAGSDTYGFLKLADELRVHHRYALGPPPEALSYVRPPGYAIFVMLVKGDHTATMTGGDGWWRIVNAQRWIDLVVTGFAAFAIALAIRGAWAGTSAFALAMVFPFTMIFFAAGFTETVAIALTTLAFALVASDSSRLEKIRHLAAGGIAAMGTLVRQDGILVLPPLLLAAWLLPRSRKTRLALCGLLVTGFAVVFSPWPIRNEIEFGKAWPFGTHADRYSHPVEYYGGYYSWLNTWGADQSVYPKASWCFFDPSCFPNINTYPPEAFDSAQEKSEVDRLLAYRRSEKFSARVSDGFAALAQQKRRSHLFRSYVSLPLRRIWNVWINEHNDINHSIQPWPKLWDKMRDAWWKLALGYCIAVLVATALLLIRKDTRRITLVLFSAIALRTLFLAYFFYIEPRYTVEVMPLGLCLIAAAAFVWQKKRDA